MTLANELTPIVAPGRSSGLLDVMRRRYLLKLLVRKELRVRYRGSVLGLLWTYVKPAVQFVVFYLALGVFLELNKGLESYSVYLFSGLVVINFFAEGFSNSTRSIVANTPLVKKIFLPRELFPVASIWVSAAHFFPQLIVLIAGALLSGWRPTVVMLLCGVMGFLIIALLSTGLGLIFGAINVMYRDAENLVDLIVMVATWTSPVMYPFVKVQQNSPEWLFSIYQLNPLTIAVELFHYCFWYPTTGAWLDKTPVNPEFPLVPDHLLWYSGIGLGIAAVILAIGQFVFSRLEGRFAQEL